MIDADKDHEPLFCRSILKLGEIHWYVLRADAQMAAQIAPKANANGIVDMISAMRNRSPLAEEVGGDEINWWVRRKETNLDDLHQRTTEARAAAHTLLLATEALRRGQFRSYADIIDALKQFAETHSREIEVLHKYVHWLANRDPLAPTILFTYRVWGSTRRSDRRFKIEETTITEQTMPKIRQLTEVVLGLQSRYGYVVDKVEGELIYEQAEAMDSENLLTEITVPLVSVLRRASYEIFDECEIYFRELRSSLANIVLEIEKYIDDQALIHSDGFWRKFICETASAKKAESQLWDFKETLTMWVAQGEAKENGKIAFAEDVASLANAEGGVLLVGVTDKRDVVGIGDDVAVVEKRLKFASDVVASHLEYPRTIARFQQVEVPDKAGNMKLCLVVIVAKACEPVGVKRIDGSYSYPVRHETGIMREKRADIVGRKLHLKSESYEFFEVLKQFVRDVK